MRAFADGRIPVVHEEAVVTIVGDRPREGDVAILGLGADGFGPDVHEEQVAAAAVNGDRTLHVAQADLV
jgi:hypothetical protein